MVHSTRSARLWLSVACPLLALTWMYPLGSSSSTSLLVLSLFPPFFLVLSFEFESCLFNHTRSTNKLYNGTLFSSVGCDGAHSSTYIKLNCYYTLDWAELRLAQSSLVLLIFLSSEAVPLGEVSRTPDEVSSEDESAAATPWQNKKLGVPWETALARPCSMRWPERCEKFAIGQELVGGC